MKYGNDDNSFFLFIYKIDDEIREFFDPYFFKTLITCFENFRILPDTFKIIMNGF
jgi:hypothetical protein